MSGMNENPDLKQALERLAELAPRAPRAVAEERLARAFRSRRHRRMPVFWAAAAAFVLIALAWAFAHRVAPHPAASSANSAYVAATSGFVALPYAQSDVPLEEAVIVRVRLQPSALSALGMHVGGSIGAGAVDADLLVGQDGVPRAVRLID